MSRLIIVAVQRLAASLASSMGASLLGFLQYGIGAVLRSIEDRLRENVSVTDFMTLEQRAAIKDSNSSVSHTDAFEKAFAAADVVRVPVGFYNAKLKFNKDNVSMRGAGYNRVVFRSTDDGVCIQVAGEANVSGLCLKNIKVQGTPTGEGGIKLGSENFYCAIPMFENVNVWDHSRILPQAGFGIQLYKVQNGTFLNCWIYRNRYGYHRPNAGYCTSVKISGKSGYSGEGYVGIYVDGFTDDLYIDDAVIEGGKAGGVIVTQNAVRADRGSNIFINGAYTEANGSEGGAAIVVEGGPGPYQQHVVTLERIYFAANAAPYVIFDRVIASVKGCKLTPRQVQTTANCNVHFEANKYPTGSNYLTEYREMLGNITVKDFVDAAQSNDLNQLNLVNALTFPEVPRHVDDIHTLDDYQERVLGQWVPDKSGFGGMINRLEGRYIKIGRMIHIHYLIDVTAMVSNWTVSALTLPFPALSPASMSLFNGSTGQSLGSGYVDPAFDKLFLPNLGPINGVLIASGSYVVDE